MISLCLAWVLVTMIKNKVDTAGLDALLLFTGMMDVGIVALIIL